MKFEGEVTKEKWCNGAMMQWRNETNDEDGNMEEIEKSTMVVLIGK